MDPESGRTVRYRRSPDGCWCVFVVKDKVEGRKYRGRGNFWESLSIFQNTGAVDGVPCGGKAANPLLRHEGSSGLVIAPARCMFRAPLTKGNKTSRIPEDSARDPAGSQRQGGGKEILTRFNPKLVGFGLVTSQDHVSRVAQVNGVTKTMDSIAATSGGRDEQRQS